MAMLTKKFLRKYRKAPAVLHYSHLRPALGITSIMIITLLIVASFSPAPTIAFETDETKYSDIYINKIVLLDGSEEIFTWQYPGNYFAIARVDRGTEFNKIELSAHMGTAHLLNYNLYGDPSTHDYIEFDITVRGSSGIQTITASYDSYNATANTVTYTYNMPDSVIVDESNDAYITISVRLV